MGRTREFDINAALRIAADLFWRKGYDNTSISDMTRAMGITPPSFYAAFGSKEGLFEKIVEDYQARQAPVFEKAMAQPTVHAVIDCLLFSYVDLLTEKGRAPGCLVMNSSLPVVDNHPFRKRFADDRKALKAALSKRFKELSRDGGETSGGSDPAALAQLVVAMIWGLAVEAQSGTSRASLRATVKALCARLGPQRPLD